MAPQVSDSAIPVRKHGFLVVHETNKYETGIAMTAQGDFPVRMMEEPKISIKESLQKEKQIVVDPLSSKESYLGQASLETTLPLPPVVTASQATKLNPPPLQPPRPKFLSISLPNSANSSPRLASVVSKKKSKGESPESPCPVSNVTHKHQHFLREIYLQRSKSCGEGRACTPSNEFDLWLIKPSAVELDNIHGSFSKTEPIKDSPQSGKHMEPPDEGFKCSALCLYLPGFGKAKPVRAKKEESHLDAVISRTVSLEKFECGSWASSAIIRELEGGDSTNSYFDLPLELIKCSTDDAYSPVTAAFVFDKDLKGVLKNGSTRASGRKSDASPRHVRFSTSYPASPASSCITPRLQRAREEFNAFLEAQSA